MPSFNVLDPRQDVHNSYLLEASAGTGKTFSIENIVVRLLAEEKQAAQELCTLDQILVVTFTRAATRDLKVRIRGNIQKSLNAINLYILSGMRQIPEDAPPYLKDILAKGSDTIQRAKRSLENALKSFDKAPIFTIHSFCRQMLGEYSLEGDIGINALEGLENIPDTTYYSLIRDFFRTELQNDLATFYQLKTVIESYKGVEKLQKSLVEVIKRGIAIDDKPSTYFYVERIKNKLNEIKGIYGYRAEYIREDLTKQEPYFKKIRKLARGNNLNAIERFSSLFDKDGWGTDDIDIAIADGEVVMEKFAPSNICKNKRPIAPNLLHYPDLIKVLRQELQEDIQNASDAKIIFACIASKAKVFVENYLHEQELLGFDGLLKAMQEAVTKPEFQDHIRRKFRAAIIDEFQDTDPVQWNIFSRLFLSTKQEKGWLYLVGDPKQSIYAFRQADIYTYLRALDNFGKEQQATLDTSYRSQESLVTALNVLFDDANAPGLFVLPRNGRKLSYNPVKYGGKVPGKSFNDEIGSVHFFFAEGKAENKSNELEWLETKYFFPFIVQEIQRLHAKSQLPLSEFAVLVVDRYQSHRLTAFLKERGIPAIQQRPKSLKDSIAIAALKEILEAILNPSQESKLKIALGGPFWGWNHKQIQNLNDLNLWEQVLAHFYKLRKIWMDQGIALLYQEIIDSPRFVSDENILDFVLSQESGMELYEDFEQIFHLLIEFEAKTRATSYMLMDALNDPGKLVEAEDKLNKRIDSSKEGVKILTMHSSKGLEFDVVFALGLIKTKKVEDDLIPIAISEQEPLLVPYKKNDPNHSQYCQEIDAEKIRQLYVAMTRAKYRLYVPAIFPGQAEKCNKSEVGCASPMELYLAHLGRPEASYDELYDRICQQKPEILYNFIDGLQGKAAITYTCLTSVNFELERYQAPIPPNLQPPPKVQVLGPKLFMNSYTSLVKRDANKLVPHGTSAAEAPHDFKCLLKTPHTLPSGSMTGTLLHLILEKFPLGKTKDFKTPDQLEDLVRPYVQGTPFLEWRETIAEILFNALSCPLRLSGSTFQLCQLNANEFYRETEFLYPCEDSMAIPELELKPGYVKGVIDLIFMHAGKYYLVDWKSNWLGSSLDFYSRPNLEAAMRENAYHWQAELYKKALERYLRLVDPRPFREIFGGIYYLFLRGLDKNSDKGIYTLQEQLLCQD